MSSLSKIEEKIVRISTQLELLTILVQRTAERTDELYEAQQQLTISLQQLAESQNHLAESQNYLIESQKNLHDVVASLIKIIERHLANGHGGSQKKNGTL